MRRIRLASLAKHADGDSLDQSPSRSGKTAAKSAAKIVTTPRRFNAKPRKTSQNMRLFFAEMASYDVSAIRVEVMRGSAKISPDLPSEDEPAALMDDNASKPFPASS